jgi:Uma2 family endonuclease
MEPMAAPYTRAQYALLPESFPAQLIEGALVCEPAPIFGHQRLAFRIAKQLERLVGDRRVGLAPVDIHLDEFNVYQPDVVVFREPVDDEAEWERVAVPLLVVEVLSPSTQAQDRNVKRVRLLAAGVREVWLVDRKRGSIEVYDGDHDAPRLARGATPIASKALRGFVLDPESLFRR